MNRVGSSNPYNRNGNTHQNSHRGNEHFKRKTPGRRVGNGDGLRMGVLSSHDLFSYFLLATLLCSFLSIIGHFVIVSPNETPAVNYIQGAMKDFVLDTDAGYSFEQRLALWYGSWDPKTFNSQKYPNLPPISNLVYARLDCHSSWNLGDYFDDEEIFVKRVIVFNACANSADDVKDYFFDSEVIEEVVSEGTNIFQIYSAWVLSAEEDGRREDEITMFLRDNSDFESESWLWWSAKDVIHTVMQREFACVQSVWEINQKSGLLGNVSKSFYHFTDQWSQYRFLDEMYVQSHEGFRSQYESLGHWVDHFSSSESKFVVPVCYGSNFAVSEGQIQRLQNVFQQIEEELKDRWLRKDDIEENHYLERSLAYFLSPELSQPEKNVLLNLMDYNRCEETSFWRNWCGVMVSSNKILRRGHTLPSEWSLVMPGGGKVEKSSNVVDSNENVLHPSLEAAWHGVAVYDEKKDSTIGNAHLVLWMSCDQNVQWLGNYVKDVQFKSITVYALCEKGVATELLNKVSFGSSSSVEIKSTPLHVQQAYLHFMTKTIERDDLEERDIVLFAHDNPYTSQDFLWWKFDHLVQTVLEYDFGCAESGYNPNGTSLSAFYKAGGFNSFVAIDEFTGIITQTKHSRLIQWLKGKMQIHLSILDTTFFPTCFGDTFLTTVSSIRSKKEELSKIESRIDLSSLSEDLMYVSRSWAYLLRKAFDENFSDDINELTTPSDEIPSKSALFIKSNLRGGSRFRYTSKRMNGMISLEMIVGALRQPFVEALSPAATWAGTAIRDATKHLGSITVVLSYCEQPLHWVESFLRTEFEISINIISKCEMPLTGIKSNANFNVINNKGDKNHHYSYAQWISNMTNVTRETQNDVVIFLNDMPHRSKEWKWWSLNDVLRTVSSNGFACFESVYEATGGRKLQIDGVLGYYHDKVSLEEYEPNSFKGFYPWFESTEFSKMREWITAIKADKFFVQELVPVCYGGAFATTKGRIDKAKEVIGAMELFLERENDIVEAYFAERTWAAILSKPLSVHGYNSILSKKRRILTSSEWEMRWGATYFRNAHVHNENLIRSKDLPVLEIDESPLTFPFINERNITALWTGNVVHGDVESLGKMHLVVSHCDKPLHWLNGYIEGHQFETITIFSKCGNEVEGAPDGAIVETLDNVGRCDHTYANWMSKMPKTTLENRYDPILFIKDNNYRSDTWALWTIDDMRRIVSGNGFACGESVLPPPGEIGYENVSISIYHDYPKLRTFHNEGYSREKDRDETSEFKSKYKNLGEFWDDLELIVQRPFLPVCYGGIFMTTRYQIEKQNRFNTWEKLVNALARGDNIEEGHFVERTWSTLLSKPINPEKNFYLAQRNGLKRCIGYFMGRCGILTIKPWNVDAMLAKQGS